MADVQDVASYIVYLGKEEGYTGVNNQTVNNLLFLCERQCSRYPGQTLVPYAHFVNGHYGPSDPRVLQRFERYGMEEIPEEEGKHWCLSAWEERLIRDTAARYMNHPASVFSLACQEYQMAEYEKMQKRREEQERMMFPYLF